MQRPDVTTLDLPQIAFAALPVLASFSGPKAVTGLHGSRADCSRHDDNHALLMPCLYELHPGT
ncbi:hypothetical protein [Novosphingobium sp. TCA1]|uniref:hypothetical protein n=1 Tax=Novosphingobium sp. TCA1 TaxID=2682474 RepID=UPI0010567DF5|nr:hypothetical protein [Novosphingobium sp. TCA1]